MVAYTAAHYSTPRYFPWILPFSLGRRDSLLPINDQGKRRAETAKKPVEFDLSFMDPETASFRPRGQKPSVYSDKFLLPFPRIPPRALPSRNTGSK